MNRERKSPRWSAYDYSNAGMYFITIVTKGRENFFGKIEQGIMHPEEIGLFTLTSWQNTPLIRPDMNIHLEEFVLMPNHFHGILVIGNNQFNQSLPYNNDGLDVKENAPLNISPINHFGPQSKNLAAIIRGFKASVTSYAIQHEIMFEWQSRYHDHIIRDYVSYLKIANYIIGNPENWKEDKFHQ
jgi:REP element-mobilizing transposase RayT